MEFALLTFGAFLALFFVSMLVYWIAQRICAFCSLKLRDILRRQSWIQFLLVPAASAVLLMLFCIWPAERVIRNAKIARTANEATQIQTAILGYYTEYSELPHSTDNATLIKILAGDNQRGIMFLSPSRRDLNDKGEMIDAWKKPFRISFADAGHSIVTSDSLPAP